ncbi:hypothetical protein ISTM_144 [Insectomime virus]|uniref:MORN repeat-containing protein n=1 Tax=Tunisvirus fontaine2 TaxID=1421067 RepID=V9SG78_9VIRU|nr:hypothetical protein D1R32_gp177 [Tunisvirus fontaine2]AHA46042.1 hypothetical protein ISTM_144 [Insectomime virus]AHC54894.1 hypothetical protein TNS_ORF176 [Tunisvirus fontaine2]
MQKFLQKRESLVLSLCFLEYSPNPDDWVERREDVLSGNVQSALPDGTLHGMQEEKGVIQKYTFYNLGKMHGWYNARHKKKGTTVSGRCIDGVPHGKFVLSDVSGKKICDVVYNMGKLVSHSSADEGPCVFGCRSLQCHSYNYIIKGPHRISMEDDRCYITAFGETYDYFYTEVDETKRYRSLYETHGLPLYLPHRGEQKAECIQGSISFK